jgi:hypothetical protein
MATALGGDTFTLPSAADNSSNQFKAMTVNSSGEAALATVQGEKIIGVLQNDPDAQGKEAELQASGVSKVEAGAAFSIGDELIPASDGQWIAATDGEGVAVALEAASAAADVVKARLRIRGLNPLNADGLQKSGTARATYDFSVDGGAVGDIGLGVSIPDNAVVTRAYYYVATTLTSSGDSATGALGLPTDDAAGLLAAIAISATANPWDAGWHECIQDGTAANFSEVMTAARELTFTVAVEAVTAGKFILFADYVVVD